MGALAEGQMPVRLTREQEAIRVCELLLVAVGRADRAEDHLAAWNQDPGNGYLLARIAFGRQLDRAGVTQQLFDRRFDQRWIVLQQRHLLGMLQESKRAARNQVNRSFMA